MKQINKSNSLYDSIKSLIEESKAHIVRKVNITIILTYYEIGRMIVKDEIIKCKCLKISLLIFKSRASSEDIPPWRGSLPTLVPNKIRHKKSGSFQSP
jgi:hypothetical protein